MERIRNTQFGARNKLCKILEPRDAILSFMAPVCRTEADIKLVKYNCWQKVAKSTRNLKTVDKYKNQAKNCNVQHPGCDGD